MKNMKKIAALALTAAMLCSVCACAADDINDTPTYDDAPDRLYIVETEPAEEEITVEPVRYDEDIPEATEPDTTETDITEPTGVEDAADLASALTDFGLNVMNISSKFSPEGKNISFSPFSAASVLVEAMEGAQDETLSQLEDAMGGLSSDQWTTMLSKYPNTDAFTSANSIWANEKYPLSADYTNKLHDLFDTELKNVDFKDKATADIINEWCSDNTDGLISQIASPDSMDGSISVLLINASLFEDKWEEPYEDDDVYEDRTFTNALGEEETCELMYWNAPYYYDFGNAKAFRKFYENGGSLLVILPDNENTTPEEVLESLEPGELQKILDNPKDDYENIRTCMPKITTQCDTNLKAILQTMGVDSLFDPYTADLQGFTGTDESFLYVSDIQQKTYIEINEQETKAAAVTYMTVETTAAFEEPKILYILCNRPYAWMILDENNIPLFMGIQNSTTD